MRAGGMRSRRRRSARRAGRGMRDMNTPTGEDGRRVSTDQGGPVDLDRMPSSNLDAERWVLACMMSAPLAVEQSAEIIGPGDFYRPGHGEMFYAMVQMYAAQEPITPVTLRAWMERG